MPINLICFIFSNYLLIYFLLNSFLEVGHTQSEGDSMHACIENYTKRKTVYTQKQWAQFIVESKQEKPSYIVKQIQQPDINNYDQLSDLFNWKSAKVASIREIHFIPNSTDIHVKYNFFDSPKAIKILKKNKKIEHVLSHKLQNAYTDLIPLNEKKKVILNV